MALADGRRARFVFTDAADGDMHPAVASVDARRAVIADDSISPDWTWLNQVHGRRSFTVTRPGEHAGADGDAALTRASGAVISVRTADCAPIALAAVGGAIAVIHAGWRGLMAGVVEQAVADLSALASGPIQGWLGPCIGPECYEFSADDLEPLVERFGSGVAATTAVGTEALDLVAAVTAALNRVGIEVDTSGAACTACGGPWFSHRARGETARQVLAAWIEPLRTGAADAGGVGATIDRKP